MSKVLLKFKNDIIQEYILDGTPLTIGRTEDNTIHIDNLGISRNHARIICIDSEFFIEDLNSQNGTSVNSLPIKRCALRDKDEISIGKQSKHTLIFKDSATRQMRKIPRAFSQREVNIGPPEETLVLGKHQNRSITSRKNKMLPCLQVIEGDAAPPQIILEKVLLIAGRGGNADLFIHGDYETDVVFIISNRPTGFFLSPTVNTHLSINDKLISEVVQLKEGHIIQFQNVKIKFTMC